MWNSLRRTAAPATTIVSLAEAQAHLRVDNDNDVIERLIDAATAYIEGPHGAGLALLTQTWKLRLDRLPALIRVPLGPVQSVTSITYLDAAAATQTLSNTLYRVEVGTDPATIAQLPNATYPVPLCTPGAVTITFVCGYGSNASDVPADLRHAALLLIGHLYENREATSDLNLSDLPMGFESVLNRYRAVPIA